jgi:hypothetical protein
LKKKKERKSFYTLSNSIRDSMQDVLIGSWFIPEQISLTVRLVTRPNHWWLSYCSTSAPLGDDGG